MDMGMAMALAMGGGNGGSGGGGDNIFVVPYEVRTDNLSVTADKVTCDMTYAEIAAALTAGKIIVPVLKAHMPASSTEVRLTCFGTFYENGGNMCALFNPCLTGAGLWVLIVTIDSTDTLTIQNTGLTFE